MQLRFRENDPATPLGRVIIVLGSLSMGGAERQALMLGQFLKERSSAHVEVMSLSSQPGSAVAFCEECGIDWFTYDFQWREPLTERARELWRFASMVKQRRPRVLLSFCTLPNIVCGLTWRLTGARLAVWNQRDSGLIRMGRRTENMAVKTVPLFISNSEHGTGFLQHDLGVAEDKIAVVPNGVNLLHLDSVRGHLFRKQMGIGESDFVATMVANFTASKDHVTLLRAWQLVASEMSKTGRKAVLLLAGAPGETTDIAKAVAFDLDLQSHVSFLGHVSDILGLLSATDLSVLSSKSEGVPNGVLECMAAGLPTIGTDIPGVREAVGEGRADCLVGAGDPQSMANMVLRLAANPDLRASQGAANRQRVETHFAPLRVFQMYANVLKAVLGTGQLPAGIAEQQTKQLYT